MRQHRWLGRLPHEALRVRGVGGTEHPLPGFGEGGVGFAPALLRFKPRAFGRRALLPPRGQLRGVDALAAQQCPDLATSVQYNLLFRWFVGLDLDAPVWDVTVFTKNRDRLLAG